jgi:hypothetical protein
MTGRHICICIYNISKDHMHECARCFWVHRITIFFLFKLQ